MKLRTIISKAVKIYLAAYVAGWLAVAADQAMLGQRKLEENESKIAFQVRKYELKIDDKPEYLTLIGEVHSYTKAESEIAQKLVSEHSFYANECGNPPNMSTVSTGNKVYLDACSYPLIFYFLFNHAGSGRTYDSMDEIAVKKGKVVYPLEDNNAAMNCMSNKERTACLLSYWADALKGPLAYYQAKQKESYDLESVNKWVNTLPYKSGLVYKRDILMAEGIIDLLRRPGTDTLLASVGLAHLQGVEKYLTEHANAKRIE